MQLQRTVKVALKVAPEQGLALLELIPLVTNAYNEACLRAWADSEIHSWTDLHRAVYYVLRSQYGLPSQFVCNIQRLAWGSVSSLKKVRVKRDLKIARYKAASKNSKRAKKKEPQPISCPRSDLLPIPFESRTMKIRPDRKGITFSTMGRRIEVGILGHKHLYAYRDWQANSGRVSQDIQGHWWLALTFIKEVPDPVPSDTSVVGCDRGIVNPAVLSTGLFVGDPNWHQTDRRYFRTQQSLQRKGTKSAKRRLRARSRKWSRFRSWVDHNITSQILHSIPQGTTLVLEDLTDIRQRGKRFRKDTIRRLHSWSFRRQQEMLTYKAPEFGVSVVYVDPRYTSQKCSECGFVSKQNRTREHFHCKQCGHRDHADFNASKNIRQNWITSQLNGNPPVEILRDQVSPPNVTHSKDSHSKPEGWKGIESSGVTKGSTRVGPKSFDPVSRGSR